MKGKFYYLHQWQDICNVILETTAAKTQSHYTRLLLTITDQELSYHRTKRFAGILTVLPVCHWGGLISLRNSKVIQ